VAVTLPLHERSVREIRSRSEDSANDSPCLRPQGRSARQITSGSSEGSIGSPLLVSMTLSTRLRNSRTLPGQ
jgi:hypothetical protein